jgi:hypothetical protein
MDTKDIEFVSVRHFSGKNNFKCIVINYEDNLITLKLTKEFAILNLFESDPIVFGYEKDNTTYLCEGIILDVIPRNNSLVIKIESIQAINEKRLSERYPVSLYAEIKVNGSKKRDIAVIRNVSLSGVCLRSKTEFQQGDILDFDAYINNIVMPLRGTVIWKIQISLHFEYGIVISFQDFKTKNTLKNNIQIVIEDNERSIMELKS